MRYLKVLIAGLVISFIGALPFGTLNITAFHIAASKSVNDALFFALGAMLAELVIVRISLLGSKKINFGGKISAYLLPLGICLLLYLSFSSFMSLNNQDNTELGTSINIFPSIQSTFLLGILLSVLNPLHIPFWLAWNKVLIDKDLLNDKPVMYSSYIAGIGVGTFGALLLFIFAGTHIFKNYDQYSFAITISLGLLYLGFAGYLIFLLYKRHLKLKIR